MTTVNAVIISIALLLALLFLLIIHILSKDEDEAEGYAVDELPEEEDEDNYDYGFWLDLAPTPEETVLDTDESKDIPFDWRYTPIRRDASDWVKELDLTLGRRATTFRTAGSQRRPYQFGLHSLHL